MDLLSMLMSARVCDVDGDVFGEVVNINISGGKLEIMVDVELDDGEYEEDDPDGGEEVDDEHELDKTEEVPKPVPLRAVAGGKK